jgi:hypothetical protein
VGDFFVSHAGFHVDKFLPYMSEEDNIKRLYQQWENDKLTFSKSPYHWIWEVGSSRGGLDTVGSPVWLDFFSEFMPLDNTEQIAGHSNNQFNPTCKKNAAGLENWCIDREQSCYAVWQNGKLEIKRVTEQDYRGYLEKL